MYTSIKRVRDITGFDDTTNFPNEGIVGKILIAGGMIDSAIGANYLLPLPYHYQNTLTFGGLGTGSGTMAITINSVVYSVAVTSGARPETIADLFRIAAADSDDFITDKLGSGSVVLLISKTSSATSSSTAYAEVNITDPSDTNGITGTGGSRSTRYPVVIEQISCEIAGALMFIDQYGIESQNSGKEGTTRMDAINATLQKLQGVHESGQRMYIFDEVTSIAIPETNTLGPVSYPNDTSDASTTDSTSPKVWMNQEF